MHILCDWGSQGWEHAESAGFDGQISVQMLNARLDPSSSHWEIRYSVVHVCGVMPGRRLELDTIFEQSVSSSKREFVFQCDVASFLLGDLMFDAIETQANDLLRGIVSSPGNSEAVQPARIFIAYDLGSLVMKKILDFFTATLGVTTEVPVPQGGGDQDDPLVELKRIVSYRSKNWANNLEWNALQRILLPLSFPQHQQTCENKAPHGVLNSQPYKDWRSRSKSPILYIQGQNEEHSRSLAEQVLLSWQSELRKFGTYHRPFLSFSFSSHDPNRNNMNQMVCSAVVQTLSAFSAEPSFDTRVVTDMLRLYRSWTIKSCQINISRERKALWNLLERNAEDSDSYIKVVVTSRHRLSLLGDSDQSSSWCLYDGEEQPSTGFAVTLPDSEIVEQLCLGGHGKDFVENALQRLISMDRNILLPILNLIRNHTGWPHNPSARSWTNFSTLLDWVQPSSSPAVILDWILRSLPDQERLRWALHWLIYGHRPVSTVELACVFIFHDVVDRTHYSYMPNEDEVEEIMRTLKSWLPALVHFTPGGQACVRTDVRDLLCHEDPNYLWNEIKPATHQTILDFLTTYLLAPKVVDRLTSLYDHHLARYASSQNHTTPSIMPDGKDFIFYAITAFPYHLEKTPGYTKQVEHIICGPSRPLQPWAKMCWAMSNAFTRAPVEKPDSILSALSGLGYHGQPFQKTIESVLGVAPTAANTLIIPQHFNEATDFDIVYRAVSVLDEEVAVTGLRRILAAKSAARHMEEGGEKSITALRVDDNWFSELLWRATWLNLSRIVDLLLDAQISPEAKGIESVLLPSPLFLASRLGHTAITRALLEAEANTRVLKRGEYGMLLAAASNGHADVVRAIVAKDPELLELEQPFPPLEGAATWGTWRVVKTLLELGARPDFNPSADGWTPLMSAADDGYSRTVRVLLENHADPNHPGPNGEDTPLLFATVRSQNVDTVRALLDYGADPNHECIKPPLVVALTSASSISSQKKIELLDVLSGCTIPLNVNSVSSSGTSGLMWPSASGDLPLVDWLLAHGADVSLTDENCRSPLFYAIVNKKIQIVERLLTEKAPVDILTDDGQTLLQIAASISVELVILLLDAGANPELENEDGLTVINTAVQNEKLEVVKLLIERKVNIHHRDAVEWSPIHDASGYRPNVEIVRALAKAGANLTETTSTGRCPLHLSVSSYNSVNADACTAALLEFRGAVNIEQRDNEGETPLLLAAASGNLGCVQRLVQAGANINAQSSAGWSPLFTAVNLLELHEISNYLLSLPGIDVSLFSKDSGGPFHMACQKLDLEIISKLIDRGADVNQIVPGYRPTPLMAACMPNGIPIEWSREEIIQKVDEVLRTLVSHDANVTLILKNVLSTPLFAAALYCGPSTFEYLVAQGLSLKQPDPLNRLPIHFAAFSGCENFEAIVLRGFEPLSEDIAQKNALHWAAQGGHVETVGMILSSARSDAEKKVIVNRPDIDGWTPLCWVLRPQQSSAIRQFSEPYDVKQTVQALIAAGADTTLTVRMGQEHERFAILDLAELHRASDDIVTLLTDANANSTQSTDSSAATGNEAARRMARVICPYDVNTQECDLCLNTIWGPVWSCETCVDFYACKKCHGRIDLYHAHYTEEQDTQTETGGASFQSAHTFKLHREAAPEFRDISEPSSPSSSIGSEAGEGGRKSPASDGSKGDGHDDQKENSNEVDDAVRAIMEFDVDEDI
ncbi:ankyrin repeat-containing domain protein [Aspergillus karnatakaensis]|uniref:ankyrin repeat-containing domain protein n=1 Tax=Aspergillus karnatakaensis TaxID=1810916 RepID=UPI003CCCA6EA